MQYKLIILLFIILQSCKNDSKIVLTIAGKNYYQTEIDSIVSNDLKKLRKEALTIFMVNKLIEKDAKSKNLTVEEYEKLLIVDRSKKVTPNDIEEYFNIINATDIDSFEIDKAYAYLKDVYQRFRFEVVIDSLKLAYKVTFPEENNIKLKTSEVGKMNFHKIGNNNSKNRVFFIADYDCHQCYNKFIALIDLLDNNPNLFQFCYVNYSGAITEKEAIAESVYLQSNSWEIHRILFENNEINDSLLNHIAELFNLDLKQLKSDILQNDYSFKLKQNQKIIEDLSIFHIPTIIINDEIYSGNINIELLKTKIQTL
jgi:protein-disulfide isomerase